MASPRVFISSTCYDLADERDGLAEFCESFGFDVTLSERGDIFFHPDLHTHVSCVRETSNCQLFILIIGGRFGGKYVADKAKSITNAEYAAAVEAGIPTFTFVKQDVLSDHNVWQRNKGLAAIQYPSIEKQEFARDIFEFIDQVRQAPVNNGFFGFRLGREIYDLLRKQWAGMMLDFLQNRTLSKQLSLTNVALSNLAVVSTKIEELVKHIYRNVDESGAPKAIADIERISVAEEFLIQISAFLSDNKFINADEYKNDSLPEKWWEFLEECSWVDKQSELLDDGQIVVTVKGSLPSLVSPYQVQPVTGKMSKEHQKRFDAFQYGYDAFKSLDSEAREKLVTKYLWKLPDSPPLKLTPPIPVKPRKTIRKKL
ncbi:DUF4062 domain-containing protein [Herbaspirillum sp. RU 5E]|nr:DUF4062 domain-containing protein [Herbaspirillum sp. RU 5E]